MASAHVENIAPNFTQWPPCDYSIVESIAWDIPTITDDTDAISSVSDYSLRIQSSTLSIHGVYTIILTDTVTYDDRGTA